MTRRNTKIDQQPEKDNPIALRPMPVTALLIDGRLIWINGQVFFVFFAAWMSLCADADGHVLVVGSTLINQWNYLEIIFKLIFKKFN